MHRIFSLSFLLAFAQVGFGQLSGPLSGTLGPGTYHVIGSISVESGDTLRLMPGTTFIFDGGYPFRIYGTLLAEGTETDSVVFTTDTLANPDRWRGLRFYGSGSSGSRLAYCVIENGLALGTWPDPNSFGGGVYLYDTSPNFHNCVFANDSARYDGGAVYCYSSFSAFTNCTFMGNSGDEGGECSAATLHRISRTAGLLETALMEVVVEWMRTQGTQNSRTASSAAIRRT
ncbi:MAG: right-handed parallel beta-helix repeat-containing protein [bacterium]